MDMKIFIDKDRQMTPYIRSNRYFKLGLKQSSSSFISPSSAEQQTIFEDLNLNVESTLSLISRFVLLIFFSLIRFRNVYELKCMKKSCYKTKSSTNFIHKIKAARNNMFFVYS